MENLKQTIMGTIEIKVEDLVRRYERNCKTIKEYKIGRYPEEVIENYKGRNSSIVFLLEDLGKEFCITNDTIIIY